MENLPAAFRQHSGVVSGSTPEFSEEYVERGRELVRARESNAWQIGDYLLEGLPMGSHGGTGTGDLAKSMRILSALIGLEEQTLVQYRKVAHAWPSHTRIIDAPWSGHQAMLGPPETAPERAETINAIPRNKAGVITQRAVIAAKRGDVDDTSSGWEAEVVHERGEYEALVSPKALVNAPRYTRGRIKDALMQVRGIIQTRLDVAKRPYDMATENMMAEEIRGMVAAIRSGSPSDVRCARLGLAATLILLAERDDRPAAPPEGERAAAARRDVDLSIDGDVAA